MTINELNELRKHIGSARQLGMDAQYALALVVTEKMQELLDLAEWALCMEWISDNCFGENCPFKVACADLDILGYEAPCNKQSHLLGHKKAWLTAYRQQQK